jgi:alpha-tubulin suppressor-like RCC1 family protein
MGRNQNGQLGLGDLVYRSSPAQIGALATWAKIAGGQAFSLAIKVDGTAWAWGRNNYSQLGFSGNPESSPVQIGALTNWANIAAGTEFSIAVKTDGTLWGWGRNQNGQLGINSTTTANSPVQIGALTTWYQVACGGTFTLATKTDGTLWSWGLNAQGQLGLGDNDNRSSPVQIGGLTTWYKVAAGVNFTIAITTSGALWSWGFNNSGQLGLNTSGAYASRNSPVQIGTLTTWYQATPGYNHTLAVKTDGTLWSWGVNTGYGQLGLGDTINRSSPVQVGALSTWANIAGGGLFSFATNTNGALWGWGRNSYGQLGLNDTTHRSSPVQVGALTTWLRLPKMPTSNSSLVIKS